MGHGAWSKERRAKNRGQNAENFKMLNHTRINPMKTEVEFEQFFKSKLLGDLEELEIKRLSLAFRQYSKK